MTTAWWAARVRLDHPNRATTDAIGDVGAASLLGVYFFLLMRGPYN
jgi:hypothetical protein